MQNGIQLVISDFARWFQRGLSILYRFVYTTPSGLAGGGFSTFTLSVAELSRSPSTAVIFTT
jgi:hypothetical protein